MSSNKSEHFQLHLWNPQDDFLREEFNENFAALDAATGGKIGAVFGSYTGNGANSQHINLGSRPTAVHTAPNDGTAGNNYNVFGGLFGHGAPLGASFASVDDTGFTVIGSKANSYSRINDAGQRYHYLAFFA